ncbi:MAG: sigma-70 family RNA polymerase sigma factor, partial [Flavobacteriales bacterium]|nr:sigma-70 family RNA polymerase sigma factor [Flavobacteriales bacterium]
YLFNSVANRCKNWIRDHKKFQNNVELEHLDASSNEDAQKIMEFEELQTRISNAIQDLPDRTRNIFEMNRFEGLKYQEIADELDVSVKTVEAQMSKALKFLRDKLSDYIKLLIILFLDFL